MLSNCIFCKIIAGQLPTQIIAQTNDLIVIKDLSPKASIHYLILPKQHVTNLLDLSDWQIGANIILMAQNLAKDLEIKDFRLITNNGTGAGQSVFHLHFHFLAGKNIPEF